MSRGNRPKPEPAFLAHKGLSNGYLYLRGEHFASFLCYDAAQAMADILNAIERIAPHAGIGGNSLESNRFRIGVLVAKHCGVPVDFSRGWPA